MSNVTGEIDKLKETVDDAIEDADIKKGVPFIEEEQEDVERKQELKDLSETYLKRIEVAAEDCRTSQVKKYRAQLMNLIVGEVDYEDMRYIRERLREFVRDVSRQCSWTERPKEVLGL